MSGGAMENKHRIVVSFVMPWQIFGRHLQSWIGERRDIVVIEKCLWVMTAFAAFTAVAHSYAAISGRVGLIFYVDIAFGVAMVICSFLYASHYLRIEKQVVRRVRIEQPDSMSGIDETKYSYVWCYLYASLAALAVTYFWSLSVIVAP